MSVGVLRGAKPQDLTDALLTQMSTGDAIAFVSDALAILKKREQREPLVPPPFSPRRAGTPRDTAKQSASPWEVPARSADEERHRKIELIFKKLDADGSKVIKMDEFVAALTTRAGDSIWGAFSADDARALFKQIDVTRTGKITKAKFGHFVDVKSVEAIRAMFKEADNDGNRQISSGEFKNFARRTSIPRSRVDALWAKLDANDNGRVSWREFVAFAEGRMKPATIDALFRSDPDDSPEPPTPPPTDTYASLD